MSVEIIKIKNQREKKDYKTIKQSNPELWEKFFKNVNTGNENTGKNKEENIRNIKEIILRILKN